MPAMENIDRAFLAVSAPASFRFFMPAALDNRIQPVHDNSGMHKDNVHSTEKGSASPDCMASAFSQNEYKNTLWYGEAMGHKPRIKARPTSISIHCFVLPLGLPVPVCRLKTAEKLQTAKITHIHRTTTRRLIMKYPIECQKKNAFCPNSRSGVSHCDRK